MCKFLKGREYARTIGKLRKLVENRGELREHRS